MFNPLELPGPLFLLLYFVSGVVTLKLLDKWIKASEGKLPMPELELKDPYQIAYLRGGESETIRVALMSLIDRRLIDVSDTTLKAADPTAVDLAKRPLEKAILKSVVEPKDTHELYKEPAIKYECSKFQTSLQRFGLLVRADIFKARLTKSVGALLVILGLAIAKIWIAIQTGHTNIIFLLALAVGFTAALIHIIRVERTRLGDYVIRDLRVLFRDLKDRSNQLRAGGKTNEAAFIAAIYGFSALPDFSFPYLAKLFPKSKRSRSGNSDFDFDISDSSCGSSCSSSCGGGCGGGCGGCGGD